MLKKPACYGVTCFMVSYNLLLFGRDDLILLLQTTNYAVHSVLKVLHINGLFITTGGNQGRFVTNVGNFGPGKTRCLRSQFFRVDIRRQFDWLQVNPKNGFPTNNIGFVNANLTIKTSRTRIKPNPVRRDGW